MTALAVAFMIYLYMFLAKYLSRAYDKLSYKCETCIYYPIHDNEGYYCNKYKRYIHKVSLYDYYSHKNYKISFRNKKEINNHEKI